MADIKQQLDKIKERISDPNFLANKGLSNEVGIHVFTYEPQYELMVRECVERLVNTPSDAYRIIERDLYKILLEILEDKRVLSKVASMEEKKGKDFLLKELQKKDILDRFLIKLRYAPHQPGDVIFLMGVGKVYPFMRAHIILSGMQKDFTDVPIVMFYPGEYNGQSLILFNKFLDGNYYRAFNLL